MNHKNRVQLILLLASLAALAPLTIAATKESVFSDAFSDTTAECKGVHGRVSECAECYLCDDPTINLNRNRLATIHNVYLINSTCNHNQVCCLLQGPFLGQRTNTDCGKPNPDGYPRKLKPSLKAVLPGEYPWRAWIFRDSPQKEVVCAGTYVSAGIVLTLASCLDNLRPSSLRVAFERRGATLYHVQQVQTHDDYRPGSSNMDAALVHFSTDDGVPKWVHSACLPASRPRLVLDCLTVSDKDILINERIQERPKCTANTEGKDESGLCTVHPSAKHRPERGAGLYCIDEYEAQTPTHVVYGVARKDTGSDTAVVSLYTDVSLLAVWIENAMK